MPPIARIAGAAAAALLVAAASAPPALTAEGLGKARIGMTVRSAEAALGYKLAVEYPNDKSCGQGSDRRLNGVSYLFENGKLARIDVTGGKVQSGNIGIGASESAVRRAFGKVTVEPHKYVEGGHYLGVRKSRTAGIVFETDKGRVTRFRAGRYPAVDYVEGCL